MVLDEDIFLKLGTVLLNDRFEVLEGSTGCGGRNGRHGLDITPGVLDPLPAGDHPRKIDVGPVRLGPDSTRGAEFQGLGEAVQYPAEHHVLERLDGPFAVVHLIELLKGLQEVGMGGIVIAFLTVERSRHGIDCGLERRGDVDGVRTGSGGSEGGLGLGHTAEAVVDFGLDQMRFHQKLLVVELLKFDEQVIDEGEGVSVLLLLVEDEGQLGLDALAEEGPLLRLAPLYDVLTNLGLLFGQNTDMGDSQHEWKQRVLGQVVKFV